jgi:endonuclease/exonuclease/phosphatase family metal-dependent hydrolase
LLKGVLVTRVGPDGPWVLNTHLGPNHDGDWSDTNRHAPLHRHQLHALAGVVRTLGPAALVVCGDFNVAAGSTFLRDLLDGTGLVDAFGGDCPPTYRPEFLSPGRTAHRIDFVLTTGPVTVTGTDLLLTDKHPFPDGPAYLSDHLGLRAALHWTRVNPRTGAD